MFAVPGTQQRGHPGAIHHDDVELGRFFPNLFQLFIEQFVVRKLLDSDGYAAFLAESLRCLLQAHAFHALFHRDREHLLEPQCTAKRVDSDDCQQRKAQPHDGFWRQSIHADSPVFACGAPRLPRKSVISLASGSTVLMAPVMYPSTSCWLKNKTTATVPVSTTRSAAFKPSQSKTPGT